MNLRHAAALTLVGWYMMVPPVHAADVGTRWYMMTAPFVPSSPGSAMRWADSSAPISRWTMGMNSLTQKACEAFRSQAASGQGPASWLRCISTDDLAHARTVHTPGWLVIRAPHDDATAPLAQWVTIKESYQQPDVNFPSENACERYRTCMYLTCLESGMVVEQLSWWSQIRAHWQRWKISRATRCVAEDDARLKVK
jgi:hypothetical protein